MNKPTLEELAVLFGNKYQLYGASDIWDIETLHKDGCMAISNGLHTTMISIEDIGGEYVVIAKPLSDLTKEQMMELLWIITGLQNNNYPDHHYKLEKDRAIKLTIDNDHFSEQLVIDKGANINLWMPKGMPKRTYKQIEGRNKLYSWHYDCFNGIKEGWAVDYNTLKQNY